MLLRRGMPGAGRPQDRAHLGRRQPWSQDHLWRWSRDQCASSASNSTRGWGAKPISRSREGRGLYHGDNAVLKRVVSSKGRATMILSELEAVLAWLGLSRIADFLHLLDGVPGRPEWHASARRSGRAPTGAAGDPPGPAFL